MRTNLSVPHLRPQSTRVHGGGGEETFTDACLPPGGIDASPRATVRGQS